jgi:hypothetical protein
VTLPTGLPEAHQCHPNVDAFVAANPDHRAIRGWLKITDFTLQQHSVVSGPGGELFDITPLSHRFEFFAHPGLEGEFWRLPPEVHLPIDGIDVC